MGRPYGQPSNQKLNQGIFSENTLFSLNFASIKFRDLGKNFKKFKTRED